MSQDVKRSSGAQREEGFLKRNPSGRSPVIVERGSGAFPVFGTGAIMFYLAEKAGRLLPSD